MSNSTWKVWNWSRIGNIVYRNFSNVSLHSWLPENTCLGALKKYCSSKFKQFVLVDEQYFKGVPKLAICKIIADLVDNIHIIVKLLYRNKRWALHSQCNYAFAPWAEKFTENYGNCVGIKKWNRKEHTLQEVRKLNEKEGKLH